MVLKSVGYVTNMYKESQKEGVENGKQSNR